MKATGVVRAMQSYRFLVFYAQDYPGARILEVASLMIGVLAGDGDKHPCLVLKESGNLYIYTHTYIYMVQVTADPRVLVKIQVDFGQSLFFPELPG